MFGKLFGYGDPAVSRTLPWIGSPLLRSSVRDVLLVSIEVDTAGGYERISPGQSFHVGVSVFDPRHLFDPRRMTNPRKVIRSYQFINQDTKSSRRAAEHFLLHDTETLQLSDIAARISSLTHCRDHIVVAHGTQEPMKFLKNIHEGLALGTRYIWNAAKAAECALQLDHCPSLEDLLGALDISYARLNVAGNNAFFALKALLMLAARMVSRILMTTQPNTPALSQRTFSRH